MDPVTKTTRWEVVKFVNILYQKFRNSLSCLFFFIFRAFPVQIMCKHTFFLFFSLRPHPPLIQRGGGGACSTCIFIFLLGHAHIWPKRGGGGYVPEMSPPPPPPPPRSTYEVFDVCIIEMRNRRQNNNRPINLPQGNNIHIKGIYNFQ